MTPDPGTMAPDPLRKLLVLVLTVLTVNPLRERLHCGSARPLATLDPNFHRFVTAM